MKQHPNGLMVCCHGSWSLSQQGTIFDVFDTFPHHQQRDARMGAITEGLQALPPYESVTHLCVDGSPQSWTQAARSLVAQDIDVVVMCGHDDIEVVTQAVKLALEDRFVLVDVPHFAALDVFFWLLTELPVSATQVASVLLGVVGSYPALRRVCPHCAIEQQPEPFLLSILNQKGIPKLPDGKWVQGQGCTECYGTGFKDPRLTVAEAIYVDASLAQLCESGPSKAELHTAIVERGFQTYFQQAFTFAQQGDTTLAEAIRVGLARRAEL
jgi:type II secretory ATPase GspE/PulE/Tfp pilus assembly ATPase PilB-like protein